MTAGIVASTGTFESPLDAQSVIVVFIAGTPTDTEAPLEPTGLTATALSETQIGLTWTGSTDNVGVTAYQVRRNGMLVATVASPSYTDESLSAATTYTYTVAAVDAAGNVSGASTAASATTVAPDTTAPAVSVTAPAPAATVAGSVSVSATATDAGGVVGVQFRLDGQPLGAELHDGADAALVVHDAWSATDRTSWRATARRRRQYHDVGRGQRHRRQSRAVGRERASNRSRGSLSGQHVWGVPSDRPGHCGNPPA